VIKKRCTHFIFKVIDLYSFIFYISHFSYSFFKKKYLILNAKSIERNKKRKRKKEREKIRNRADFILPEE